MHASWYAPNEQSWHSVGEDASGFEILLISFLYLSQFTICVAQWGLVQ